MRSPQTREEARPLVSSVIIFLNAQRFIEEAIESVFAQTYEHWELLLVDDGSTDGSAAIAQYHARRHPAKVRYLEHEGHENRGMSASRNLGLTHARGRYVAFLDADDVWLPRKLEEQVALLEAHPQAAMVYGRTLLWYSWTGKPEDAHRDHTIELGVQPNRVVPPPGLLVLLLQNKVQTPTTCNAMIRRNVLEEVGGFEQLFRGMYEDQVLFVKIELAWPVFVADACWAKYRQRVDSWSAITTKGRDYHAVRLPFLTWVAAYLSRQGIEKNTIVWRVLQEELWPCVHPHLYRLSNLPWHLARSMRVLRRIVRRVRH